MFATSIDRSVLKDPSWWHWVATVPLLSLHLSGVSWALGMAAVLCLAATGYFLSHTRSVKPYPVQIRIAYLAWMLVGLLPWMGWMHWIQLAGTSAMVTVGYCPLARMLGLLPFNRSQPLTWSLVGQLFLRDPCAGGLVRWFPNSEAVANCCSIQPPQDGASCSLPHHSVRQEKQHVSVF